MGSLAAFIRMASIRSAPFTKQMLCTCCGHDGAGDPLCPRGNKPRPCSAAYPSTPSLLTPGPRDPEILSGGSTRGILAPSKAS